jgi:hypothetical protein
VIEDLAVKLFAELGRVCAEGASLATNTSTLPVVEIALATARPEKVCGIHFFNPATVMTLVEIVGPTIASDETIATTTAFAQACGKETVEVQDDAGFVVNVLLFPYLNSTVRLFERAVASKKASTRRCSAVAVCRWARSPCSPCSDWTRQSRSSTPCTRPTKNRSTRQQRCCGAWSRPATYAARPRRGSTTTSAFESALTSTCPVVVGQNVDGPPCMHERW